MKLVTHFLTMLAFFITAPFIASTTTVPCIKTSRDFDRNVTNSSRPVVVKFYANWCSSCKNMEVTFNKMAEKYSGQYSFVKIDVNDTSSLANQCGVKGVPTFLFYKNGTQVESLVGEATDDEFDQKVAQAFGS